MAAAILAGARPNTRASPPWGRPPPATHARTHAPCMGTPPCSHPVRVRHGTGDTPGPSLTHFPCSRLPPPPQSSLCRVTSRGAPRNARTRPHPHPRLFFALFTNRPSSHGSGACVGAARSGARAPARVRLPFTLDRPICSDGGAQGAASRRRCVCVSAPAYLGTQGREWVPCVASGFVGGGRSSRARALRERERENKRKPRLLPPTHPPPALLSPRPALHPAPAHSSGPSSPAPPWPWHFSAPAPAGPLPSSAPPPPPHRPPW